MRVARAGRQCVGLVEYEYVARCHVCWRAGATATERASPSVTQLRAAATRRKCTASWFACLLLVMSGIRYSGETCADKLAAGMGHADGA